MLNERETSHRILSDTTAQNTPPIAAMLPSGQHDIGKQWCSPTINVMLNASETSHRKHNDITPETAAFSVPNGRTHAASPPSNAFEREMTERRQARQDRQLPSAATGSSGASSFKPVHSHSSASSGVTPSTAATAAGWPASALARQRRARLCSSIPPYRVGAWCEKGTFTH
jgi:hypothetical protein